MGFFTARITTKELARLARRMGVSLAAGIDVRRVLDRESTGAGRRVLIGQLATIKERINAGASLAQAVRETGEFFPPLFRELVEVGEETGHLPDVLHRLADHYDATIRQRRKFLSAIAGPMIQLVLAIGILGGVIGISGFLNVDILGLGLSGTRGMVVWFGMIGVAALGVGLLWRAFRLDLPWTRPIQRFLIRIPLLGRAFMLVSMARLTWALGLAFDSGMDVRHVIRLGLRASMHPRHLDQERRVDQLIGAGHGIHETFVQMGCFDGDFLNSLRTGEESGMIAETMSRLSRDYEERALLAISALSTAASWCVWSLVALFILFFVFRIFSGHLAQINENLP